MARIRSIKPEFFKDFKLYKAEADSGLPLRVAFSGLWCCADREGRFEWVPEELKIDCLPHDQVDFSRVLEFLNTRGFIEKYEVDGVFYGWIRSFLEHQVINNRESPSKLPKPDNSNILTRGFVGEIPSETRGQSCQGEGKGREGKGREKTIEAETEKRFVPTRNDFDLLWSRMPSDMKKGKEKAWLKFKNQVESEKDLRDINAALDNYVADVKRIRNSRQPDLNYQHGKTWFNLNWRDYIPENLPEVTPEDGDTDWDQILAQQKKEKVGYEEF